MNLKELRKQSKKTASEVAKILGIVVSSYYNYEQGLRSINIEQVIILAKIYDVSAEDIIVAQQKSITIRSS